LLRHWQLVERFPDPGWWHLEYVGQRAPINEGKRVSFQIKVLQNEGLTIFLPIFFSQPASDCPKLMAKMRATKTKIL